MLSTLLRRIRALGVSPAVLLFALALLGLPVVSLLLHPRQTLAESWPLWVYVLLVCGAGWTALRAHQRATASLRDLNEELSLSQGFLEDSEEQLKLRVQELSTLTTVLQKAPFGISFADPRLPDMPLVYVNDAFEQTTGYSVSEALGRNCRFLQGPDTSADTAARIRQAIAHEDTAEFEVLNYRKNGEPFWNRFLIFPSYDAEGNLLHFVGCQTDITALKEAEREHQALEAEVQESAKLESLGLTIAGVAHDLNTPIGVAVTAASHLERQAGKIDALASAATIDRDALLKASKALANASALISNNLNKAATLVRSFKQATADASRTEWRTVALKPFMESLLVSVSPLLRRAQCTVELSCPDKLELHTEPGSLMQVITNLLVNATVHAFEGRTDRRVALDVRTDGDAVLVDVTDNGNGMTEEALAKAFRPFFTTRRSAGGSGLGLYSSHRAVVQVLGGHIDVTSETGQGTAFHIRLPRVAATRMPLSPTASGSAGQPSTPSETPANNGLGL